mmetsp:Transcript_50048/g.106481  ORF Transcript_50048/g.106481 Transcript_50048/m.106481 type:complete len:265 (+) Transcript_50048:283-1077(+)
MALLIPRPFVATSLEVMPPLAITNRGWTSRSDTIETRPLDTAFPIAKLSAGVDPVTSFLLVYTTVSLPEATALRTRSIIPSRARARSSASSPTSSATSISIFSNPSNVNSDSNCFVVFGTYDPTTIRPPFAPSPLLMALALNTGFFGSPILAWTNDAADLTNIRFPSFSSASSRPMANTCTSRSVTAFTTQGRMSVSRASFSLTASGPPLRTSSMVMLSTASRLNLPPVFSSTYSVRLDLVNPNTASLAKGVSAAGTSLVPSAT